MAPGGLAILCPWAPPHESAITQYVLAVVPGLARARPVDMVWLGEGAPDTPGARSTRTVRASGLAALSGLFRALAELAPERVVLQYSPYLWSRSGFDLAGPALAVGLAATGRAPDVVFHELWVPWMRRPAGFVRGLVQRACAAVLGTAARHAIVTSAERIGELSRVARARPACVPMGSLVPVEPLEAGARAAARAELGLADGEVALALFGFDHDSRPLDAVLATRRALDAAGVASRLLSIGTVRLPDELIAGGWARPLGFLPAPAASRALGAADLFLAPFVDGVSTRRSSVAAALAHGLPIVTTGGHHTDERVFHPGVVALAPADDPGAFAAEVVRLARAPAERVALGSAGRALFLGRLDWPHHLAALLQVHAA